MARSRRQRRSELVRKVTKLININISYFIGIIDRDFNGGSLYFGHKGIMSLGNIAE